MKKLVICVAVLAMVWTSSAMAVDVPLVNAGFELPNEGKINGFDGDMGFSDVPGWEDDAAAAPWIRSGVDNGLTANPPHTGDYYGFLVSDSVDAENIMWQLTDKTVVAGEIYTLKVWAYEQWAGASIKLSIFSDDGFGNHTEIAASAPISVPNDMEWIEYSSGDLAVGSVGVGGTLGIAIEHIEGAQTLWMSYDDVTLDVIPEPATMMLLSLGSLALLKRRRA